MLSEWAGLYSCMAKISLLSYFLIQGSSILQDLTVILASFTGGTWPFGFPQL